MNLKTLFGAIATIVATTSAHAAPSLLVDHGILTGANDVLISGSLFDVRFVDGTCNAVFKGCSSSASFTFQDFDAASAAATALVNTVLVDGPKGLFDTNQTLTYGCGDRATCAVFVPYIVFTPTAINFTSVAALNYAGTGNSSIGEFARRRTNDTTANTQEVFAVFSPSATHAVPEPGSIALLGLGSVAALGATQRRRNGA